MADEDIPQREMPKYKCHKVVWAMKIKAVGAVESAEWSSLTPEEEGLPSVTVSKAYIDKHNPKVGDYYVKYEDGYESWSLAEAFEQGYTKVPD